MFFVFFYTLATRKERSRTKALNVIEEELLSQTSLTVADTFVVPVLGGFASSVAVTSRSYVASALLSKVIPAATCISPDVGSILKAVPVLPS
jgi:hypothetical protein